jgi:hypothetical protein
VRHQNHRSSVTIACLAEHLEDFLSTLGIKIARGFVSEYHSSVGSERPGNRHTLHLAARQL